MICLNTVLTVISLINVGITYQIRLFRLNTVLTVISLIGTHQRNRLQGFDVSIPFSRLSL